MINVSEDFISVFCYDHDKKDWVHRKESLGDLNVGGDTGSVNPASLISSNANNSLILGSDGKLYLNASVGFNNYYTKAEVNNLLTNLNIPEIPEIDLSNYAKLNAANQFTNIQTIKTQLTINNTGDASYHGLFLTRGDFFGIVGEDVYIGKMNQLTALGGLFRIESAESGLILQLGRGTASDAKPASYYYGNAARDPVAATPEITKDNDIPHKLYVDTAIQNALLGYDLLNYYNIADVDELLNKKENTLNKVVNINDLTGRESHYMTLYPSVQVMKDYVGNQISTEVSRVVNQHIDEAIANLAGDNISITSNTNTSIKSYIDNQNTYTYNKQDTGKVWVNGKKIYRQAFTGNITIEEDVHHTIPLITAGASAIVTGGGMWNIGNGNYYPTQGINSTLIYSGGNISFYSISDFPRVNASYTIFVEYTDLS